MSKLKPTPHTLSDKEIHNLNPSDGICWCLHCERVYEWGQFILEDGLQYCPYEDCNGDTVMDSWAWKKIREANPSYPEKPLIDTVYALYS